MMQVAYHRTTVKVIAHLDETCLLQYVPVACSSLSNCVCLDLCPPEKNISCAELCLVFLKIVWLFLE